MKEPLALDGTYEVTVTVTYRARVNLAAGMSEEAIAKAALAAELSQVVSKEVTDLYLVEAD